MKLASYFSIYICVKFNMLLEICISLVSETEIKRFINEMKGKFGKLLLSLLQRMNYQDDDIIPLC